MKKVLLIILIFIPALLFSQWSNDPSINTLVYQGGIYTPKIVTADNFYYISYFKVTANGYIPFLQRINYNGYADWPDNGIQISDHNRPSIYNQYDIKVDKENNAILAIRNEEAYLENSYLSVYKISPEGEFLWGDYGKNFDIQAVMENSPSLIVNHDNSITLISSLYDKDGLQGNFDIGVNKYSSSGEILWEEDLISGSDSSNIVPIGTVSSPDGGFIILYRIYNVIYPYSYSDIYARKLDSNGTKVWTKDLQISHGDINSNNIAVLKRGSKGEVFIAWTSYKNGGTVKIQAFNSDGSFLWDAYPIEISGGENQCQKLPRIGGQDSEGNLYLFWSGCPSGFNRADLFGQKISMKGELLWEKGGRKILVGGQFNGLQSQIINDTIILVYKDPVYSLDSYQNINSIAINTSGEYCWEAPSVLNSEQTDKNRITLTSLINGQAVVCFGSHDRWMNSGGQVKIQNFWMDGSIGLINTSVNNVEIVPLRPKIIYNAEQNVLEINDCERFSKCSLIDLNGRTVKSISASDNSDNKLSISLPEIKSGIYIVQVITDSGVIVEKVYLH